MPFGDDENYTTQILMGIFAFTNPVRIGSGRSVSLSEGNSPPPINITVYYSGLLLGDAGGIQAAIPPEPIPGNDFDEGVSDSL